MGSELVDVLRHLAGRAPRVSSFADLDAWWTSHLKACEPYQTSASRAFVGGFHSDRLGYAFLSGYEEAIGSLVPTLRGVRAAFCVTESGGASAEAVETRFTFDGEGYTAEGQKSFVTMGEGAEELLIVGTIGRDDHERRKLRVARLPRDRAGLVQQVGRVAPFAPEIGASTLELRGVRFGQDEMLEGDGYDDYVKPFRTAEDLHVCAATLGHLMRIGRLAGWGPNELENIAALAAALYPLALAAPLEAPVHVATQGVLRAMNRLIDELPWASVEPLTRQRFERDKPLLGLARGARQARIRSAWRRLGRAERT
ncbi:MAG: acyl-CoA dehydrogenase [Myxococcota bacterium]